MNRLCIISGAILTLCGILRKNFDSYYEKKVLPNKSVKVQKEYERMHEELSEKGAYNVPFKGGKLISTDNTVHDRNNFTIILGIICIILGLIS